MTEQAGSSSPFPGFVNEARKVIDCLTPPEEVRQHLRNSRIEFWKAVRAMVDHRINHLSQHGQQKGTAVAVE
jgi:hypothetical protein